MKKQLLLLILSGILMPAQFIVAQPTLEEMIDQCQYTSNSKEFADQLKKQVKSEQNKQEKNELIELLLHRAINRTEYIKTLAERNMESRASIAFWGLFNGTYAVKSLHENYKNGSTFWTLLSIPSVYWAGESFYKSYNYKNEIDKKATQMSPTCFAMLNELKWMQNHIKNQNVETKN